MHKKSGFTLIELLVVISIIAILAVTIIPNFVGFDTEARLAATRSNMDNLRTRVMLFRAKEGRYPDALDELLTTSYMDAGVKKKYLDKMPPEMISVKGGNNITVSLASKEETPPDEGGWAYYKDTAEVVVNIHTPLDAKWGDSANQIPAEW